MLFCHVSFLIFDPRLGYCCEGTMMRGMAFGFGISMFLIAASAIWSSLVKAAPATIRQTVRRRSAEK
jgi:hypothetical protein